MCGDKVYFDDKGTGIATENGLTGLKVVFFSFDKNNNGRTYVLPLSIILFTETASLRSPWDFIEYTFYNDNNRKSMYDIFLQ